MFVRVAPLKRMPAGKSEYDYEWTSTEPPRVGAYIEIPFRSKKIPALITALLPTTQFQTKPLEASQRQLLTPLETGWLTHWAYTHDEAVGMALLRMLPPMGPRTVQLISRSIASRQKTRASLQYAWYKNAEDFSLALHAATNNTRSQIIIAPSHLLAAEIAEKISIGKKKIYYLSPTSAPKHRAAWLAITGSEPCVIIGAQSALWLPSTGAEIIFVEPTHEAHANWNDAPYANREILEMRAQTFGEAVTIIAHSPGTEDLNKPLHIPSMSHWPLMIDRTGDEPVNRQSPVAAQTIERIRNHARVLLFVQHLKEATHMICKDCGRLTRADVANVCDGCGGTSYYQIGLGGAHVAALLGADSRPPILIDAKSAETFSRAGPCIVIATRNAFDAIPLETFDLIIDIASDIELRFPAFNTEERVWNFLRAVGARLPQSWHGLWLVETRHPERLTWQVRDQAGFTRWWLAEKPLRERFHQPPFGPLEKPQKMR